MSHIGSARSPRLPQAKAKAATKTGEEVAAMSGKPQIQHLADLKPDMANARRHTPRNIGMVEQSLHEVGAARSIVIDEDGVILAGNGVVEAAAQAGIERVQVVDTDGETIVAVRRTGLTATQKRRLSLYDNRAAELSEWDDAQLAQILVADRQALDGLFTGDELSRLLRAVERGEVTDETHLEDQAEPLRVKWGTSVGQLWAIPSRVSPGLVHRILCGDATSADDVARLLDSATPALTVTDPPYGVGYDPGWRARSTAKSMVGVGHASRRRGTVDNDDQPDWTPAWNLCPGPVIYCWHAGLHGCVAQTSLEAADYVVRSQIIWVKSNFAISRGNYHWRHEACFYAVRKDQQAYWVADRGENTVWEINQERGASIGGHSTQKPLECMVHPIRNHAGDVYDPFLGTGTTLIAAEQLRRTGYGMEINPAYVGVALQRLQDMGLVPELIEAAKGGEASG